MIKPIVLIILDGWGLAPPGPGNAISLAKLSVMPKLWADYPHAELMASGEAVGLPPGEDGNTETGHINIGAGRVVYQDLPRITMAIADGSFFSNPAFDGAIAYAREHRSNLHLLGVVSDAGVHASREHLYALLALVKERGPDIPVYIHVFTDGRDAPPTSAKRFVAEVEGRCASLGIGRIATVMGRYYAMDRDRRWERTERAYTALTEVIARTAPNAPAAITASYAEGKTDEFIEPTVILDPDGKPYPRIANHDAVIFYNFRIDRPRQLTRAFVLPDFETEPASASFDPYAVKYFHKHLVDSAVRANAFHRRVTLPNIYFATMTEYEYNLPSVVAFPPQKIATTMGSVFASRKARQLHVSETEKERFITYYFNGLREERFEGEDCVIVPSPQVATYDMAPDMSALAVTRELIDRISSGTYAFAAVNFANPDMVAHTGNIPAAVRAVETTDACVGKIAETVLSLGGTCAVTADHGNVEEMLGADGSMDTEHSTYPVPFIMADAALRNYPHQLPKGKLADVAPTILSFRKIPVPVEMTGKNLLADVPV